MRVLLLECVGEKEEKELGFWFRQAPLLELSLTLPLYKLFEFEEKGFSCGVPKFYSYCYCCFIVIFVVVDIIF